MYIKRILVCAVLVCVSFQVHSQTTPRRIVIAASTVLDGKGRVLRNTRIVDRGIKDCRDRSKGRPGGLRPARPDRVAGLDRRARAHHLELRQGREECGRRRDTPRRPRIRAAANAWVTLMAGFTTVQSVGSPTDIPLRDAIAKGVLPGPRILTAVEPLLGRGEQTGTPDEIRAFVQKAERSGRGL